MWLIRKKPIPSFKQGGPRKAVQVNTRAKKWEWVGKGAGQGKGIENFRDSI